MQTKLLSIKQAAKHFNFPVHKLYQLVRERKCPFIEIETYLAVLVGKLIPKHLLIGWMKWPRDKK